MHSANSFQRVRPIVEVLEGRTLLSISPSLSRARTFPTHTVLTVEPGSLGQTITFDATVFAVDQPIAAVNLYYRGKLFQTLSVTGIVSPDPRFMASEATYTIPAGPAAAELFGVGRHVVRAQSPGYVTSFFTTTFGASTAAAAFQITRPQFVTQPSGVGVVTLNAGSGPALQPGQTATVQYNAYLAASYRLFNSTESQSPDTQSFTVGASPEQVIPGLDAGVVGMQAGETRAIYVPYQLGYGTKGAAHVQRRANLVYLVTLVSFARAATR